MIRRSRVLLSRASLSTTTTGRKGRTVVRDPRKAKKPAAVRQRAVVEAAQQPSPNLPAETQNQPLPFQPSHSNQESVGSTLGSYALAGAGVAMGVTLVRVLLGGF